MIDFRMRSGARRSISCHSITCADSQKHVRHCRPSALCALYAAHRRHRTARHPTPETGNDGGSSLVLRQSHMLHAEAQNPRFVTDEILLHRLEELNPDGVLSRLRLQPFPQFRLFRHLTSLHMHRA